MNRRKKVLRLVGKLWSGGIQVQLSRVLPALPNEYDCEVTGLFEGGPMAEVYSVERAVAVMRDVCREAMTRSGGWRQFLPFWRSA